MTTGKSKIYTRRGDRGSTSLGDGSRVEKHDLRIDAIGSIDELNSLLGVLLAHGVNADTESILSQVQNRLFDLGSDLALNKPVKLQQDSVTYLEQELDRVDADLPPLNAFILPGGSIAAANLQYARAVCRRAERLLCKLANQDEQNTNNLQIQFLNRLSDLLFVLARAQNRDANITETYWEETAAGDNKID